ncbi:hypothetical protein J1614_006016 [Plenodomus biglobosus]|nr:hypothetical protein J1614_006016 [Plenodomus biglobosus]
MSSVVQVANTEQALLKQWAAEAGLVLHLKGSTKRQFRILAKLLGWVSGDETWNARWKQCFGHTYIWRGPVTAETPANDAGGPNNVYNVWNQYKGFTPNPRATFNNEFCRLARHQRWDREQRRSQHLRLFNADWEAHIGSATNDINIWQDLCRLCWIAPLPPTIEQCKKALNKILVNICDILDSQRTGVAVHVFVNFDAFHAYTVPARICPAVKEAKADSSFLPVFLKDFGVKRAGCGNGYWNCV